MYNNLHKATIGKINAAIYTPVTCHPLNHSLELGGFGRCNFNTCLHASLQSLLLYYRNRWSRGLFITYSIV